MSKTITLNGHTFKVQRSKYENVESLYRYAHRTLDDCYGKPSTTKKEIYKEWLEWSVLNNVEYFGVASYNAHCFSLQGLVEHLGHTYILRITVTNNIAYIVD